MLSGINKLNCLKFNITKTTDVTLHIYIMCVYSHIVLYIAMAKVDIAIYTLPNKNIAHRHYT